MAKAGALDERDWRRRVDPGAAVVGAVPTRLAVGVPAAAARRPSCASGS